MKLRFGIVSAVLMVSLLAGCGKEEAPAGQEPAPSALAATQHVQQPLIKPVQIADWCREHGVPESICTRCNASLIADFQKRGDWCEAHELPDSQCLACHPELKQKFEAMAPKS